jgi:hypothetical protein
MWHSGVPGMWLFLWENPPKFIDLLCGNPEIAITGSASSPQSKETSPTEFILTMLCAAKGPIGRASPREERAGRTPYQSWRKAL